MTAPPVEPLAYETPDASRSSRGFRRAFWACVVYVALLSVLLAFQVGQVRNMFRIAAFVPRGAPFVLCMTAQVLAVPALALGNVLPLIAYYRAWRDRPPRGLMIVYAIVQTTSSAATLCVTGYLIARSPFHYTTPNGTGMIMASRSGAGIAPLACMLLSLPLVAMLIPSVRRASLGRSARG